MQKKIYRRFIRQDPNKMFRFKGKIRLLRVGYRENFVIVEKGIRSFEKVIFDNNKIIHGQIKKHLIRVR